MKKRLSIFIITLLTVLPVFGLWPMNVQAATYVFSGDGDGTSGAPFIIKTAEDLDHVRDDLTASYKLQADIDLSDFSNWQPIGTDVSIGNRFEGIFDGADYTIRGLTINSGASYIGLFGVVREPATIKNVRLENVDITSSNTNAEVGGLVGVSSASNPSGVSLDRISVTGEIRGSGNGVGGVVGQISYSRLSNSDAHVRVNALGTNSRGGGLVGIISNSLTEQSYATGDVSGSGFAGGLAGSLEGDIVNSYATGNVTANGNGNIGGLFGYWSSGSAAYTYYVTGIVDKRTSSGLAGALIGYNIDGGSLSNSYWNEDNNPSLNTRGWIVGKDGAASESAMKQLSTYVGWDTTIWGIQEGNSYPYLKTFRPILRVNPLSSTYTTEPGHNELTISGFVRDGSIGEPLEVSYMIEDADGHTVTQDVYTTYATSDNQTFTWSKTLDAGSYPLGIYTVHVQAKDTVVGQEQLQTLSFEIIDKTPPAAPVLISPSPGQVINVVTPTISGTAEANSTVTVLVDGNVAGTATADASENWMWTPPLALSEGAHTVKAKASDGAGNVGADSPDRTFTVDTAAPTVFVSSAGGGIVNAPFSVIITFSEAVQGFTENDMVIENGIVSGLVTVNSTTYSATVSPTTSGHAVEVMVAAGAVTDAAGNPNTISNTLQVQYDTNKPVATFGNFTDNQRFNVPPAAVTVSVAEAVYWIAEGAELDAANSLPLISMEKDGAAFTAYTASFDALAHVFTLSFNSTLQDGMYVVEVVGDVVHNVYHNILDAAYASFTVDTQPPVITLVGGASIVLTAGDLFVDPGATATDSFEGDLPVTVTGSVDNQVPGTYMLQYNALDSAGNAAVPVTRTIQVNTRSAGSTESMGNTGSGSVQLSSNANLSQLTVKANGDELKLSPIFAADTTSYRVTTSADEVSIEVVLSNAKATVILGGGTLIDGKTVALTEGDNVFELIVKSENGTVKSYSLTIQRQTELAPLPAEDPACTFRDIKGHWAEQYICEAAGKGIVRGNSETEFAPQGLVTRVEFAAMLLRALGATSGSATDKLIFNDQDQIPTWATTSVSDAVEIGILQGYPDGSLRPMQTVSRSEMAAMMVRAMKWDIEQGQMTSFADDADIPNWAKGFIYATAERGLLYGREGNQFSPSQSATRAEAATTLLRLWHVLDDVPGRSRD